MAQERTIDPQKKSNGTKLLNVRVTEQQAAAIRQIAKAQGTTVSELLRVALYTAGMK
jgi:predicted HicB family RNase H-like nuclease